MASAPDDARQQHEAEAVALALLLASRRLGQRYSLPALIRATQSRTRAFRQIEPTNALAADIAAPYYAIVRAWQDQRPALLEAYERAAAASDASIITAQVERSAAAIARTVGVVDQRFGAILARIEQWHRAQWLQRVKAATGLDVTALTLPGDVAPEASNAAIWNQQLAGDVHRQIGAGVTAAFLGALAIKAKSSDVSGQLNEVIAKAKKRSAGIGVDQLDKINAAMSRARRNAAGLDSFIWHHRDQPHPRRDHKARDNRRYTEATAPNDRAGTLPFCKCWEEPTFD